MTETRRDRRLIPEHLRHISQPWQPGTVFPYQTGWAFTIVGADGTDYHIRTTTYNDAGTAKKEMRRLTWGDEQFLKHYGEKR